MRTAVDKQTPGAGKFDMTTMSDADFDHVMATGELPAPASTDTAEKADNLQADQPAEAAAAPVEETTASTDALPKAAPEAAEPGKPKQGKKKTAGERAAEIEREAEAEERRLQAALERRRKAREAADEIEREDPPSKRAEKGAEAAAAATDPKAPEWKKYAEMPGAPKIKDFESLEDYSVALGHFVAKQVAEEQFNSLYETRTKAEREAYEADRQFAERIEVAKERADKELEADPEIIDRIDDRWKRLNPSNRLAEGERLTVAHFVKDQVFFGGNQHPLKLSEWLTANDSAELRRIGRLSPEQIIREIAIKDASFGGAAENPDDETPDGDAGARPQHARVSKAPAPSKGLSGKKAAPGVDPVKRAVADGYESFETFNALESARERGARG